MSISPVVYFCLISLYNKPNAERFQYCQRCKSAEESITYTVRDRAPRDGSCVSAAKTPSHKSPDHQSLTLGILASKFDEMPEYTGTISSSETD
jgi:hypothetical protein